MGQHARQTTARTRWRPTVFWDSPSLRPSQNVKDETLLMHKVCHGINQSFQHGHTRAAGREQTHPLTPNQEVLLTGCILGNSKKRISLQLAGRCRQTRQSCSHGYFICSASYARHLFDVTVATRTEVGTMGAGVAVHLPVNLHGFSAREEEDR